MMTLEDLPDDLLQHIITFIPYNNIIHNTSTVSTLLHSIASHSYLWQLLCKRDFFLDLRHMQTPPCWVKEYQVMQNHLKVITGYASMKVDPEFANEMSVQYIDGFVMISNKITMEPGEIITAQGLAPLKPFPFLDFSVGYFEVKLIDPGDEQHIGIGLTRKDYMKAMPGWRAGSVGFHADDGRIFISLDYGLDASEPWRKDDVCGCGVDFRRGHVFITRNGSLLATHKFPYVTQGLYPMVASQMNGETVAVNFGHKPFAFDIVRYQRELAVNSKDMFDDRYLPYSKLISVFTERPTLRQDPYEDMEYYTKVLANDDAMNFFSATIVVFNTFPEECSSLKLKMQQLLQQLDEEEVDVPDDTLERRNYFVTYTLNHKFNRLFRLMDTPVENNTLDSSYDSYACCLLKCVVVLVHQYPQDHVLVQHTYDILRALGFSVPDEDTSLGRRTLRFQLMKRLDDHLVKVKENRRNTLRRLRCYDPTYYYYLPVSEEDESTIVFPDTYNMDQDSKFPYSNEQQNMIFFTLNVLTSDRGDDDLLVQVTIIEWHFEYRQPMSLELDVGGLRRSLVRHIQAIAHSLSVSSTRGELLATGSENETGIIEDNAGNNSNTTENQVPNTAVLLGTLPSHFSDPEVETQID